MREDQRDLKRKSGLELLGLFGKIVQWTSTSKFNKCNEDVEYTLELFI